MPTRFFTLLLLVTLFFPGGVFGAFAHRCQPTDQLSRVSCCQGAKSQQPAQDLYKHLSHRCDIDLTTSGQQLAISGHKNLVDDVQATDAVLATCYSLHPLESPRTITAIDLHLHRPGDGPPAFLRNCSFLI
jgi:hypothetical protein